MNASPLPASPLNARTTGDSSTQSARSRAGRSWLFSITGVCFIFGALVAMQLRATQQLSAEAARKKQGTAQAEKTAAEMRLRAEKSEVQSKALQVKLNGLRSKLENGASLSKSQVAALGSQIKELQTVAGLTPVQGPGIRIVLTDNPAASQGGALGNTAFLPGLVHDYDLLQVVNELRLNKADAIAIQGAGGESIRVTGYTPIRCVGSPIMVNWQTVTAPFTIEAVGDPRSLRSAIEMPGGIVDNLKNSGQIGVKVSAINTLQLPAATDSAPKLRVAKADG